MNKEHLRKTLYFFVILFAISLPSAKPGMNIFGTLLSLSTIYILIYEWKTIPIEFKKLSILTIGIFLLGAFSSIVSNMDIKDVILFIRKNLYLLLIPVLTYTLTDEKLKKYALVTFIITTIVSSVYSLYNFSTIGNFQVSSRVLGFLDYSRHINVIFFSLSALLIYIHFEAKNRYIKASSILCILILILSLIVSGTRGGWLGAVIIMFSYSLLYLRAKSGYLFVALAIITIVFSSVFPEKFTPIMKRGASIFNTSNDESNTARLTMWEGGLNYIFATATDSPKHFLFGSGMKNSEQHYYRYINNLPEQESKEYLSNNHIYGGSDFHNTYIDLYAKSGVIYATLLIGAFFYVALMSIVKSIKRNSSILKINACYFTGLLAITPFYSLFQEYSTYTIAFAIALTLSEVLNVKYES